MVLSSRIVNVRQFLDCNDAEKGCREGLFFFFLTLTLIRPWFIEIKEIFKALALKIIQGNFVKIKKKLKV